MVNNLKQTHNSTFILQELYTLDGIRSEKCVVSTKAVVLKTRIIIPLVCKISIMRSETG